MFPEWSFTHKYVHNNIPFGKLLSDGNLPQPQCPLVRDEMVLHVLQSDCWVLLHLGEHPLHPRSLEQYLRLETATNHTHHSLH